MAEKTDTPADFVTILSPDLIAEIVEQYFNDYLYKREVTVVDLKPTADGYAFSLAFDKKKGKNDAAIAFVDDFYENGVALKDERDEKGRFVSPKKQVKTFIVPSDLVNDYKEISNG